MKKILFFVLLAALATGTIHYVQAQITSMQQPAAHTTEKATSSNFFVNASVTLVNNAGAQGYRAIFIRNFNETPYLFPSSGSITHSSVLPEGVYTVAVAPIGGSSTVRNFSWSLGPDYGSQTGTSATFNNVNITSGGTITVSIN
ncbi:hypothetical protein HB364_29685 [Pseudoflavitalea sp. X16]|uniref:hypothetical protein n=1 Tax=Paraflavitalea devenefica TaxID=2716334 RepID=UPI001423E2EB|nr:hypothetical protein [Paraflavitalea devenefica]NII29288.1 hypothetical protein [Paraflavitalea devenefica]